MKNYKNYKKNLINFKKIYGRSCYKKFNKNYFIRFII